MRFYFLQTAMRNKRIFSRAGDTRVNHWIDYAYPDESKKMVVYTTRVYKIALLIIPVPFFWMMYNQQSTAWLFQARRMKGNVLDIVTIAPNQIPFMGFFVALFISPFCKFVCGRIGYRFCCLTSPLRRLGTGWVFMIVSFALFCILNLVLERERIGEIPDKGQGQVRIYNGLSTPVRVDIEGWPDGSVTVPRLDLYSSGNVPVTGKKTYKYSFTGNGVSGSGSITLEETVAMGYFLDGNTFVEFVDEVVTDQQFYMPKIR